MRQGYNHEKAESLSGIPWFTAGCGKMTGAILVGGRSRRLRGRDKTSLRRDGERVLVRLAGLLQAVCGTCVLVGRSSQLAAFQALGLGEVYADLFPEKGPLGGLYTALEETGEDLLLVACDLPFIKQPLLERLRSEFMARQERTFAVLPRHRTGSKDNGGEQAWRMEPLCALWSRHCRRPAYAAIEAGELSVSAFALQVNAHLLDLTPEEAAQLVNINRPEDLKDGSSVLEIPS